MQGTRHGVRPLLTRLERSHGAGCEQRPFEVDDSGATATTLQDLNPGDGGVLRQHDSQCCGRALLTSALWPEQHRPTRLIFGGQLQPPQNHVIGRGHPCQYSGTRSGTHRLLDGPQAALIAVSRMNHQQTFGVDAMLLQSRRIRHERRRNPGDPLLRFGRSGLCQRCHGRHQQRELANAVAVDEYLGDGAFGPTAARQITIELPETGRNDGACGSGTPASPNARIQFVPIHRLAWLLGPSLHRIANDTDHDALNG
jgi:hypothetical protein